MSIKTMVFASAAALAVAVAGPASATILLGTQTGSAGGTFTVISPIGLSIPTATSNNVYGLNEKQNLASIGLIQNNLGSNIPKGGIVSSHYIFFNPVGPGVTTATGSITFSGNVFGIQFVQSRIKNLTAAYVAYKAPGVIYNYGSIANAGLELTNVPADAVSFSGNVVNYTFNANATGFDSIRVFTTPGIPEPATWAMLITGFGLIGLGMRRRNSAAIRAA